MTRPQYEGERPQHQPARPQHEATRRGRRRREKRRWVVALGVGAAALLLATIGVVVVNGWSSAASSAGPSAAQAGGEGAGVRTAEYRIPDEGEVSALPEARYDAVIPGLVPYASDDVPTASHEAYTISQDIPIYDDARTPVARFAFTNFAGRATVIVPVKIEGPWALVMTPARQQLPSKAGGSAPAQTAGWVRTDALRKTTDLERRVVVSTGQQKLFVEDFAGTVLEAFDVGVGAPGTPTPTGVTGYLQERYLDPAQGQTKHPIQLTSLHSASHDEPYQGEDGGLIGMHYFDAHSGAVSHGCIRLPEEAAAALTALPLGTSITIVP